MSVRVAAAFDALAVTSALARTATGAAAAELHLFAYFSCLIALYDGRPPEAWQYQFTATPAGAPYAHILAEEVDRLRAAGLLLDEGDLLVLSEPGATALRMLRDFPSFQDRASYVEAACGTATLRPLASISDSLTEEPQLQRALEHNAPRELFTEIGQEFVARQFEAVRAALAEAGSPAGDLLVPAAIWLGYLTALAARRLRDDLEHQPDEDEG